MKQQQESADFLGPRANQSCRVCDADTTNRGDLKQDTVLHGQYHHQISALRHKASLLPGKIKKKKFFSTHGLAFKPSVMTEIHPTLDTVFSYPPDPAHSKYYGLVQRLYPIIGKYILTTRAFLEFNNNFQRFSFPPG